MSGAADANWLLATIAQVSGALVAIIGGFLVSRVLGAVAERRTLQHQAESFDRRARALDDEQSAIEAELLYGDWLEWFEHIAFGLANLRGHADIDDVLREIPCEGRDADELRVLFAEGKAEVGAAVSRMESWFVAGEPPPPDLEEIVDLKSMTDTQRIASWGAYMSLTNKLAEYEPAGDAINFLVIPFSAPKPPAPDVLRESRSARRAKEAHSAALSMERRLTEVQTQHTRVAAASIDPLHGASLLAGVLAYLALTGIVIPLALMARMRDTIGAGLAWAVFSASTLGVVAVLAAIWWIVRESNS